MEAISCKIFTFFISYHLFKCIIPYFLSGFKCFPKSRIPITPKACISSATCCGISSMRGIVYHQAAGKYTLARDEIQGRIAPLMIYAALRASMICQACGLDKQKTKPFGLVFCLVGDGGFVTPANVAALLIATRTHCVSLLFSYPCVLGAVVPHPTYLTKQKTKPFGLVFCLVGDGGFGPPKSVTTDLQSAPFGRSGNPPYSRTPIGIRSLMPRCPLRLRWMELVIGVEPTTC